MEARRLDHSRSKSFPLWPEHMDIRTKKIVNYEVFREIDAQAKNQARLLWDENTVPKSLLSGLYTTSKILRAEAPYLDGETGSVIKMADQLELTFDQFFAASVLMSEWPVSRE